MATPTYTQLTTLTYNGSGLQAESMEERILTVLAMLVTGTNPDGTTNTATGGAAALPWAYYPAHFDASTGTGNPRYANPVANGVRSISTGLGNLYANVPFWSGPSGLTIDNVDTNVISLYTAGSVLRCGIYVPINQANPFQYLTTAPWANLLVELGQIPLSTATGDQNLATSVVIPPNTWFSMAGVEQVAVGGTRTVAGSTFGFSPFGVSNNNGGYVGNVGYSLVMAGQAGALPAQFTSSQIAPGNLDCGVGIHRSA